MNTVHDVDWNLWLVLDAILETGSVTAAANRLRRTQSAVSHSLAQLRTLFNDPLFVRAGASFKPTPRALELQGKVTTLMASARALLETPAAFDPATLTRVFRVFMSDYAQVVLLPGLLERLLVEAPKVTLDVQFRSDAPTEILDDVAQGRNDLSVGPQLDAPAGLVRQKLFDDRNVCVLRTRHPALKRFTVERFAALPHIQVSARALQRDFIDEALAKKKLVRHLALRVPHFASAMPLVRGTDAIAVVPARMARLWRDEGGVTIVEPPLPLPHFTMAQYFPEVMRVDPANVWLRRRLHETASALSGRAV